MVIRGISHREGKQGGREYGAFIDAEIIMRSLLLGPTGGLPGPTAGKRSLIER